LGQNQGGERPSTEHPAIPEAAEESCRLRPEEVKDNSAVVKSLKVRKRGGVLSRTGKEKRGSASNPRKTCIKWCPNNGGHGGPAL